MRGDKLGAEEDTNMRVATCILQEIADHCGHQCRAQLKYVVL
jgi:hypothetical protein